MLRQQTISLADFPGTNHEIGGVTIHGGSFTLEPYVPADNIHVNLGRIARVARVARFQEVTIGSYHEEFIAPSPGVAGLDSHGTATASVVAAKVKQERAEVQEIPDNDRDDIDKIGVDIKVNVGHSDLRDKNVRDPKTWAALFDKGLRSGIAEASFNHFITNRGEYEKTLGAGICAVWAYGIQSAILSGDTSPLKYFGAMLPVVSLVYAINNKVQRGNFDFEWSVIPLLPLDRALLVQLLTRSQHLVKAS